jgi:pimeloyl-ACP methyl ester carboxylesterase
MAIARITANVDGTDVELSVGYEVIGKGRPWILTPGGGHFSRQYPGIRELATALAELGNQVVFWDKPNTGETDLCFVGESVSGMQADFAAALLRHLGLAPAMVIGGSAGSRVSMLTAVRHRELVRGLCLWWLTGGIYGRVAIASGQYAPAVHAVWNGGMEAVARLAPWQETLTSNPGNMERLLAQDPLEFRETLQRWMLAMCPSDQLVVGMPNSRAREVVDCPALIFRSGLSDMHHPRSASDELAALLPHVDYVDPPWGDREWVDAPSSAALFRSWHKLAPILHDWANRTVG